MKHYDITGMSCAACSARVEKAVSAVEGVSFCAVNLLTNSMSIEGEASDDKIISAVVSAGYGASVKGKEAPAQKPKENNDTKAILMRLIFSGVLLVFLMYISMGRMLSLPLPHFLEHNPIANALTQMLLALSVMVINQKFFINGFKGIFKGAPNMDTLVALGSSAAFVYSTAMLYKMTVSDPHKYLHGLYFESAAMILTLITVGKLLESRAKGKTTSALKGLISLSPKTARVIRNGSETEIAVSSMIAGDIFVVRPGQSFPADGIVIEGASAVNEASLTGESIPADKEEGSAVFSGTVNLSGFLKCRASKVGEDTILRQIIKTVSDAAASKAPIARIADKVSGIFVPVVMMVAVISAVVWLALGKDIGFALSRAISVLVISCPCALGLATPVAIMVGSGIGAKNGILFKSAEALENTGRTRTVIFDKTGTITKGAPAVCDIIPDEGISEDELLSIAASVEAKSEHPLSKAVTEYASGRGIACREAKDFEALVGNGVKATVDGAKIYGGKLNLIEKTTNVSDDIKEKAGALSNEGKTPLYFSKDGVFLGIIAVCDEVKEDSADAIKQLEKMNIKTVMLTGDNEMTARAIAKKVGIDQVIAGVLPTEKAEAVRKLSHEGSTVMVGDGINDAPALTEADVGIAIGAGSDIAIDSADAVIMRGSLTDVCAAIRLSRNTLKNIKENLFWAFFYNVLGIPLAAGAFIPFTGWEMNPMIGALAMSLSSFFVVSNALRLNLIPIREKENSKSSQKKKEKRRMEKSFNVEGMMCPHCEAHVKKALEAIDGVAEAIASHVDKKVTVKYEKTVFDAVIIKAITAAGYEVK